MCHSPKIAVTFHTHCSASACRAHEHLPPVQSGGQALPQPPHRAFPPPPAATSATGPHTHPGAAAGRLRALPAAGAAARPRGAGGRTPGRTRAGRGPGCRRDHASPGGEGGGGAGGRGPARSEAAPLRPGLGRGQGLAARSGPGPALRGRAMLSPWRRRRAAARSAPPSWPRAAPGCAPGSTGGRRWRLGRARAGRAEEEEEEAAAAEEEEGREGEPESPPGGRAAEAGGRHGAEPIRSGPAVTPSAAGRSRPACPERGLAAGPALSASAAAPGGSAAPRTCLAEAPLPLLGPAAPRLPSGRHCWQRLPPSWRRSPRTAPRDGPARPGPKRRSGPVARPSSTVFPRRGCAFPGPALREAGAAAARRMPAGERAPCRAWRQRHPPATGGCPTSGFWAGGLLTRGLRMRLASPVTFDREDCEVAVVSTRGKWELLMTICVCVCVFRSANYGTSDKRH